VLHRLFLYVLLIAAPLLLGSNRPLFWGINGVVAALVIALFAWSELRRSSSDRLDWRLPLTALVGMFVIGVWIAVQASPWTPAAWHHPIWTASQMSIGAPAAISADPSKTWQALGWWCTLSVFLVAARLGADTSRGLFALKLMLGTCVSVALFGLAVEHFGLSTLGLLPKTYYEGWLTGTFVNRNSAASFLGIGLIIAITLGSREFEAQRSRIATFRIFELVDFVFGRTGVYAAAALVLFMALLLTGSRGGIGTAIVGSLVVIILHGFKKGRANLSWTATVALGAAISIVMAVWAVQGRQDVSDNANVRLSLYTESLEAISDRPLLGHGAGAYSSIQPLYHSSSTPSELIWDNAHSTVLEVLVTLGIPAVIFSIAILALIFFKLARAWWVLSTEGTCLLSTLGVSLAVTLHAFVDFSLEIQAIALYVSCLIGLGIGEAMRLTLKVRERNMHLYPGQVERAQA
jgi:O-antigen ligase